MAATAFGAGILLDATVVRGLLVPALVAVPVATFPGWLQVFAKASPITVAAGALGPLSLGGEP